MGILREIAAGCRDRTPDEDLLLIPDRREAIRKALTLAKAGDTVLCLGKGHEQSIIYPDGPIPWDEVEITRELLQGILRGPAGETAPASVPGSGPGSGRTSGPTSGRRT
jgi:UDP-N-acetylmuramyl tripeptide synthase